MPIVNPTREHVAELERTAPDAKPIVMVNLLRYRDLADYGANARKGVTGRAAYRRYGKAVTPLLWEVGGQVLWMGNARAGIIVPEGESWDEVVLVHYPARAAFLRMITSGAYQAVMHHRTAALADSRLIEARAVSLPRWLLGAARGFFRAKALVMPKIAR